MNRFKKIVNWIDDRSGISAFVKLLADHLVPPDAKWTYVFGSATLFCFVLQVVTGVALSLMYQPSSETAYDSLKYITHDAPLGSILRGIHYFGASAMIILVGIHMIRVYLTAAFKYPREMGWISGVFLLGLTMAMGFTGQLLRWDSTGVWSAIVGAEQAGRLPIIGKAVAHFIIAGDTLGGATLSRFFAIHVFLIPGLLFAIIALHVYLAVKNGISEMPKAGRPVDPKKYKHWYENMLKEKGVPFWPDAAWRDMVFGLLVVIVIMVLAVWVGPPEIGAPPDPANIYSNPRPDWYFLWVFAMFALMPRAIESYAIVLIPLIIGVLMVFLPVFNYKGERSPLRRPWSMVIVVFMLMIVATFWYQGVKSPWSPNFEAKELPKEIVGDVSSEAAQGAVLFRTKACLFCHAVSGHGGLRGPDLTTVGDRLTADQLTIKIVNGGGNMPAFGATLSKEELHDLVKFLETRKSEPLSAEDTSGK